MENEDKRKQYKKKWREDNEEVRKKWREANKDKLNEKYTCSCGSEVLKKHKNRHEKSNKHNNIQNTNTSKIINIYEYVQKNKDPNRNIETGYYRIIYDKDSNKLIDTIGFGFYKKKEVALSEITKKRDEILKTY